jgi:hypothetical protein
MTSSCAQLIFSLLFQKVALKLLNNRIQGTIPSAIYDLVKLSELRCVPFLFHGYTCLVYLLLTRFSKATLDLGYNEFVSNLSDDIGLLSNLGTLGFAQQ